MKRTITRIGCGVDISKDKFHVCFGAFRSDGSFAVKGTRLFANTAVGIKSFIAWLTKYSNKLNADGCLPFQIVMETTGVYHEQLCVSLHEAGLPVCVEVAARVKKYLQSIGQHSKTDKLDAKGICRMACERKLKRWRPFSSKLMQIRAALRHRKALITSRNRISNQLHAQQFSATTQQQILTSLKRMHKLYEKEIAKTEQLISALYKADEKLSTQLDPIIKSIKGLGLIGALTVVTETNGFSQITNAKQLASYAGYDIIDNQSGNNRGKTKISKRGNARIRAELYMCVLTMTRYKDAPFAAFFARIRSRNPKCYKIANVAVQRKLLLLIYTLFKNKTTYDPNYGKQQKSGSSELSPELREIAVA